VTAYYLQVSYLGKWLWLAWLEAVSMPNVVETKHTQRLKYLIWDAVSRKCLNSSHLTQNEPKVYNNLQ
jgi:hypothetical protein